MRIEIEVRNPEHFGEVLYYCWQKAYQKTVSDPRYLPWEQQEPRVRMFWGSVAKEVVIAAMGGQL